MKTNVNVIRKLNDFDVIQRTKDSMFNATALLKQWNENLHTQKNGDVKKKDMDDFFNNKGTKDFICVLKEEENLHSQNSAYLKSKASRGENAGTWMHPYLFIKFAMWLNPKFEYHVIKFVYDQLIPHRKLSGDFYSHLCSLLAKFPETDYKMVGKILNYVVFNSHEKELRNKATPDQQKDLQQVTRDACKYIEMGFINSFAQFVHTMRVEWNKRHGQSPEIFSNTRQA